MVIVEAGELGRRQRHQGLVSDSRVWASSGPREAALLEAYTHLQGRVISLVENEVIELKQNRLVCIRGISRNTTLIRAMLESMRKIRFLVLLFLKDGI